jgi:hypothetical protein
MANQQITQQLFIHELDPLEFRPARNGCSISDDHVSSVGEGAHEIQEWPGDLDRIIRAVKSIFAKLFETGVPGKTGLSAQAPIQIPDFFLYVICIFTQFNRAEDQRLGAISIP